MKPLAWTAVVLSVLLIALWWRQGDLREEIAQLRSEVAETRPITAATRPAPTVPIPGESASRVESTPEAHSRIGIPVAEHDHASATERVADLERVVTAQADLIEQLLARFDAVDAQRQKAAARGWGPEQAAGPPDTMSAGDHRTAWAPASADGGVEWIEATFETSAEAAQVIVRQTSNPGGITKVAAVTQAGSEIPIWSGEDPSKGQALADTPFAFPPGVSTARVRVYVDTSKIAGWEEIDAIQLHGRDGSKQWAKSVNASSTYAAGQTLSLSASDLRETLTLGESR